MPLLHISDDLYLGSASRAQGGHQIEEPLLYNQNIAARELFGGDEDDGRLVVRQVVWLDPFFNVIPDGRSASEDATGPVGGSTGNLHPVLLDPALPAAVFR